MTCDECGDERPKRSTKYCSRSCAVTANNRQRRSPLKERFFRLVEKVGACWAIPNQRNGYSTLQGDDGKTVQAHRASLRLHGVDVPDELPVLHSCDNKWCVNPEHLRVGTHKENVQEAVERGLHPIGARNGQAKLNGAKVGEIRSRYAVGDVSQKALAAKYGVSKHTVYMLVNRKTWKHVA